MQLSFLSLPRELRDSIYNYYVFEPDGYYYDFTSNKLRASKNRPIALTFMYTCKQVGDEMRHLALGANMIDFSTTQTQTNRLNAGRFGALFEQMQFYKGEFLWSLGDDSMASKYHSPAAFKEVALAFPHLRVLLSEFTSQETDYEYSRSLLVDSQTWGLADSHFRSFRDRMIQVLSSDHEFLDAYLRADRYPPEYVGPNDPDQEMDLECQAKWNEQLACFFQSQFLVSGPKPWEIPSEDDLERMSEVQSDPFAGGTLWKSMNWAYSAAAAAIRFFDSIPQNTLLEIRKVVLHEDHASVARPECHGIGLVPFCLQKPDLHIERRVSLWRNILVSGFPSVTNKGVPGELTDRYLYDYMYGRSMEVDASIIDDSIADFGHLCCDWNTEAYALTANGMPTNAYSLILDGDPALQQSADLFETVRADAAWQVAQLQWYNEKASPPGFTEIKNGGIYFSDCFPRAITEIVEGKSIVRCNFPIGDGIYDSEQILVSHRHIDYTPNTPSIRWSYKRAEEQKENKFRPCATLWSLLEDHVITETYDAYEATIPPSTESFDSTLGPP